MQRHHNDFLSRHRQQSWFIPSVILRKTGQDVCVIELGNHKAVEQDHTQLLLRETNPHACAVTLDFSVDAFDSDNNG